MAGRFSVEAVFKAVDQVTAPINRMSTRVGKFTNKMNRGFKKLNRNVDKFGQGIKRAGVAVVASLAITGAAMANVIGAGVDFEQTLVSAAAKFPGEIRKGTEAFKLLEDAARKAGSTTEFTASQSAEALNFLAMAGLNAESSVAALPGVINLATAAGVDLATATDVATDSLGAFGLMTDNAAQLGLNLARVNDVIAKTTTTANTTVESMFETIKNGGPVAVAAGASIETFAALTGELANAGIKGSQAGVTLKNVFLKLAAPSAKGAKLLQRFGVATQDANGDMIDVVDILDSLGKGLVDLGSAEKAGVLEGIFGKIPIAGVNVLLKSGTKRLKEYRLQLEGASGASSKMASVMRDTLQGRLNSLNSAVEGVKISIFSLTSGPLSDVVDKMTVWVRANEKLIASNIGGFIVKLINNLENIFKWVKRIGIALAVFITFTTILKTLILVMTALNIIMALNPIGLIVLGVAALIAGFALLITWIDEVSAGFNDLPVAIQVLLMPIGLLINAIKLIKDNSGDIVVGIVSGFEFLLSVVQAILQPIGEFIDAIKFIKNNAGALTDLAGDILGNAASNAVAFAGDTVDNVTSGIGDFFGFGDNADQGGSGPLIISPQERTARIISEQTQTNKSEITIRDETGRAEVTSGGSGPGLDMQLSGEF